MTALHLAVWTFGFLAALAVRGLVEWWRLRRSFVRFRVLDELPRPASRSPHMDAWLMEHAPTDDELADRLRDSFPRCLPDPSPRPGKRAS